MTSGRDALGFHPVNDLVVCFEHSSRGEDDQAFVVGLEVTVSDQSHSGRELQVDSNVGVITRARVADPDLVNRLATDFDGVGAVVDREC